MFSFLARLRVIILSCFLFLSLSYSREESLFTSSVTYCEPPETLLIQQFDIAYFARNQSVLFNISAASVTSVNVTANLLLNVYGLNPVNITLDLCNILGGALCPLPKYNFTGSDSISLPDSLGVSGKIPGIAFRVPDLEGFAQLILTEVGTGKVKACVQATLSNGWSTHQPAVEWATGGLTLAALLSAIWQSVSPDALAPFRLLDLLHLYQAIASTSFLSLNYPSTYRAFTLNFAWAMGLFSTSSSSSLQNSINRMRHLTGGKLPDATSGSAVGLVNRKLSPYNAPNSKFIASPSTFLRLSALDLNTIVGFLPSGGLNYSNYRTLLGHSATGGGEVQTVTTTSSNILQAGIPIYVNSIHIATANAFMTVFICALILIAIALGAFVLGYGMLSILCRIKDQRRSSIVDYGSFIRAWCLRLGLVIFSPVITFVFYQWTLKDSWLSILISVITFLCTISLVAYPTYLTIRVVSQSGFDTLYSDPWSLATTGPLYAQYRIPRFYFFIPLIAASILKSLFIAFGKGSGEVQVIALVIIEGLTFISYTIFRPYKSKGGDIFGTFLATTRLICTGLMIAFVESLNVAPIPRVVIGLVIAVIFSIAVIITILNLIIHSGVKRLWKHRPFVAVSSQDSDQSIVEKGGVSVSGSLVNMGRPVNPTPEQSALLHPYILQPHPISPTETTEHRSTCSRDSGTITVGSLLTRRWSFSPLNSPTNSSHAHEPSSCNSNLNVLTCCSDTMHPQHPHQ